METIDIIKELCNKNKISISQLENILGYGNGSIAKSKSMSADRVYKIAQHFNVPMEYLMTGKTVEATENEIALLRQQQSILIEINKINNKISDYYKEIAEYQSKLDSLKKDYAKIQIKINEATSEKQTEETTTRFEEKNFDDFFMNEPLLPFDDFEGPFK